MKQLVIGVLFRYINFNCSLDNKKIDEVMYGLEALYLNITKLTFIILGSLILGNFTETVIFLLLFNNLRLVSFGVHAKNSIHCWIASTIFFLGLPLLATWIIFNTILKYVAFALCLWFFILYAPADTTKRPLVNARKRLQLKLFSILLCILYGSCSLLMPALFISNAFLLALILEAFLITPLAYNMFGVPYENYRNYEGGDTIA